MTEEEFIHQWRIDEIVYGPIFGVSRRDSVNSLIRNLNRLIDKFFNLSKERPEVTAHILDGVPGMGVLTKSYFDRHVSKLIMISALQGKPIPITIFNKDK